MERKFEILDHTADAKFRAYGRTLEEAVANAALAMVSLMWDYEKVALKTREEVEIKARSFESLMVKFLSEILYLFEVKGFLLGKVEEIKIEVTEAAKKARKEAREKNGSSAGGQNSYDQDYILRAILAGDLHSEKYEIMSEVKAATYNDFALEKGPDGYRLQMVVDM
ncbi:MAG: archease [Candidatus Aminicenantes bacterium]|nr:archease [Candidatus Aminicenantes bacterium]